MKIAETMTRRCRGSRFTMRFSIRDFLIAVVLAAFLLAPVGERGPLLLVFVGGFHDVGLPTLAVLILLGVDLVFALWLVAHGRRQLAAAGFGILSIAANGYYAACCIAPSVDSRLTLYSVWLLAVSPSITSLGWAWAILASREGAIPRRPGVLVWFAVLTLTLLPAFTLVSCWPLRIAFLVAKPALERVADQVAAGRRVALPQQAGLFRLRGRAVDPFSDDVVLMIDPILNKYEGFVRIPPGGERMTRGSLISGATLQVHLGGRWWYRRIH